MTVLRDVRVSVDERREIHREEVTGAWAPGLCWGLGV